ncbi:MAG TPA: Hsp20/alpha crystallin family protein [Anaerolineae bacterium]|nr:Hsp20/alpha crystallin family protein [Anaerolineae bacterium]
MGRLKFAPRENWAALRDALYHLWSDARFAPAQVLHSLDTDAAVCQLLLDVYWTADEVIVRASVPGVKAEDLEITLRGDQLTVSGSYGPSLRNVTYCVYERPTGRFARTLTLDVPVDAQLAEADLREGVLTIVFPKKRATQSQPVVKVPL